MKLRSVENGSFDAGRRTDGQKGR